MQNMQSLSFVSTSQPNQWFEVIVNKAAKCQCVVSFAGEGAAITGQRVVEFFQHLRPQTVIDFHQALEEVMRMASEKSLQIMLAAVYFGSERSYFAAYQGRVVLRRGEKIGVVVKAAGELRLVEGNTQAADVFLLVVGDHEQNDRPLQEILFRTTKPTQLLASITTAVSSHTLQEPLALGICFDEHAERAHAQLSFRGVLTRLRARFFAGTQAVIHWPVRFIKQRFASLRSSDPQVQRTARKKLLTAVFPILGVVFIVVIGTVVHRLQVQGQLVQAATILEPYKQRVEAAKAQVAENPIAARESVEAVVAELDQQIKTHEKQPIVAQALTQERALVQQFYQTISGQEEFPLLPTYFDLRLVQSSFVASRMDLDGKTIVFLDSGEKKVLAFDVERKQSTLLPVGDYPQLTDVALSENALTLLANGLFSFPIKNDGVATQVRVEDEHTKNSAWVRTFGEFIYLLDKPGRNIFRYSPGDDKSLGQGAAWLRSGESLDFEAVQSFAIDGDLWIGTKTGEIMKLTSGKVESFATVGLKEAFATPITVYTKENLENLYVLEPAKSRLVVLKKNGEFVREVRSRSLESTTQVVASEELKKAFALSGALLFEIQL